MSTALPLLPPLHLHGMLSLPLQGVNRCPKTPKNLNISDIYCNACTVHLLLFCTMNQQMHN